MWFQSTNISLLHMSWVYLPLPEFYSVVLISWNIMWKIRNEVDKHLSELNKLTIWHAASASVFMGSYVSLLIKDCRYFFCSSKTNLWRLNISLVSFRRSEEICEIGAFVFACVILFPFLFKIFFVVDMAFLSNFFEFWQLSFGLSIKNTHETEWSKVTQWNETEEFWEKSKVFGAEWHMFFFVVFFISWLLISEQILIKFW